MFKKRFIISVLSAIFTGFVLWRITTPTSSNQIQLDYNKISIDSFGSTGEIFIGDDVIKLSDVDFEFNILTKDMFDETEFKEAGDQIQILEQSKKTLRNQILLTIIERKLLFQMLSGDKGFVVKDSDLDSTCRKEWSETIKDEEKFYSSVSARDKLRTRLCEQYIVDKYMSDRIYSDVKVSDEDAEYYYKNNKSEFFLPKRITFKHMQLPDEKTAKNVLYRTTRRNFSRKAKEYSISQEGKEGGTLGPYSKRDLPPVFADAFKLKTNQISQIIKSTYGFHIIMVTKKHSEKTLAFNDVKDDIKERLLEEKKKRKYQQWLELALNSIDIKTKSPLESGYTRSF